jgi:hypothetical protein
MNKRDIKIYDKSWNNISEFHTEYDDRLFPEFKFYYHLIESDPTITKRKNAKNAKLVYDSETSIDPGQINKVM